MSRKFKEGLGDGEKMVEKRTDDCLLSIRERRTNKLKQKRQLSCGPNQSLDKLINDFNKFKNPLLFSEILIEASEQFVLNNVDYVRICMKNIKKDENVVAVAANLSYRVTDSNFRLYILTLLDKDFIKDCTYLLGNSKNQATIDKILIFFGNLCTESHQIRQKVC